MIVTHQKQVPYTWMIALSLPWAVSAYTETISGAPLTFTMDKYIKNPMGITALSGINTLFNFLVGVFAAYFSDRIWTRFGRRKPFLIASWIGAGFAMLLLPIAPSLVTLIFAVVVYQFCIDLGRPWEPLFNEIVPPHQRGRATMFRMMLVYGFAFVFWTFIFGQFRNPNAFGLGISGEQLIYGSGTVVVFGAVLFITFFVKETIPPSGLPLKEPFDLRKMFRDMFSERQAWFVYLLYCAPVIAGAASGSMMDLYRRNQLGLTEEFMGRSYGVGIPFQIFLMTPLCGYLADKFPRMLLFRIGILGPALVNIGFFYLYVRYVADYNLDFWPYTLWGMFGALWGTMLAVIWGPITFDYIPERRLGTYMGGIATVTGLLGFGLGTFSGAWVTGITAVFGTRGKSEYDYSSVYILSLVLSFIAIGMTVLFSYGVKRRWVVRAEDYVYDEPPIGGFEVLPPQPPLPPKP